MLNDLKNIWWASLILLVDTIKHVTLYLHCINYNKIVSQTMIIVKVMKFLDSAEIIDTPDIPAIWYSPQDNKYDKYEMLHNFSGQKQCNTLSIM
jgi:hypothetical protein